MGRVFSYRHFPNVNILNSVTTLNDLQMREHSSEITAGIGGGSVWL